MSGFFDIYSIIFLVIAVVIFMRLNSVLGRRTGDEPTPGKSAMRRDRTGVPGPKEATGRDNVVRLPHVGGDQSRGRPEPDVTLLKRYAKEGTPAFDGLMAIARTDPSFNPQDFVSGARAAYEMIVTGFAQGDRKTLKPLLADDVLESFEAAILEREKRRETVETTFVGIDDVVVESAELDQDTALITLRFDSEIISATRDDEGRVVAGDATEVQDLRDIWTFARSVSDRDPNWKLVATTAE